MTDALHISFVTPPYVIVDDTRTGWYVQVKAEDEGLVIDVYDNNDELVSTTCVCYADYAIDM